MPTVSVRDIDMYYQVHGNPDGEPLVLLHGFTSTGSVFDPFLEQFGRHYRLYVPDWRGHGRTTNPQGEIRHEELAKDTTVFAKEIGLERAHFCGISSGGMQLTFLALQHPQLVYSLTYIVSTYTYDEHVKAAVQQAAASVTDEWLESLKGMHEETHGQGYAQKIIELWLESILRPNELPFTPDDLRRIECPTLIIHGDRDHFFPVHVPLTMYQAIPEAELCIMPNCGHNIDPDSSIIPITALLNFLTRHPLFQV